MELLKKETLSLPDIVDILGPRPYPLKETVAEYLKELRGSFFSIPAITLSVASSNSLIVTESKLFLAAIIAASLHMFCMSAPLKPGVSADIFLANSSFGNFSSVFIFFK